MADEAPERDIFAEAGITDADFEDEVGTEVAPVEAPEAPAEVAEQSDSRPRDENGRFVAKEGEKEERAIPETRPEVKAAQTQEQDFGEAPSRFSADARAAWAQAPLPIRAEIGRAITELEKGLQGYQQTVAPLKSYIDMAGGPEALAQAAQRYIGIEQQLAADPIKGLGIIANNLGTDLRTIAAQVLDQPAPENSQEMAQLRHENQQLKNQMQQFQTERMTHTERQVQTFAETAPRFQELTNEIAWALKTGLAQGDTPEARLKNAYEYAERLKPAPQPAAPAAIQQQPQTPPPENLSVDGAPGSTPGYSPPKDRRQNIADRLAEAGL